MSDNYEKQCPGCGQYLRFPKKIGGMLMACPSCGHKFRTDFRFNFDSDGSNKPKSMESKMLKTIFEFPNKMVQGLGRYLSSRWR